jgi:hypothetical protein
MAPRAGILAAALAVLCLPMGNLHATETSVWPRLGRALAPDHARLQLAGGQGFLSAGPGWDLWPGILQAETLYGYAPASLAGRSLHALSLKATVSPLSLGRGKSVAVAPLLLGVSANVALGDAYMLILPERFRDYYWPSALRFWIFGGMRAAFALPEGGPVRAISAVAEAGSQDAYWQAWAENDAVRLGDIMSLSLAVQVHFRE